MPSKYWLLGIVFLFAQTPITHGRKFRDDFKEIDRVYLQNIIDNMDTSVDPCDDLFGFACGNWIHNYNSTDYVDMAGYMDSKVNQQLLDILRQRQHDEEGSIYAKLWLYYETCETLTQPALNTFLRLVQEKLNFTWPIFRDDWDEIWAGEKDFDWLMVVAGLRWYGLNGVFITQNINVRLHNGSHHILEIHRHQSTHELREEDVVGIFTNFGMEEFESIKIAGQIMVLERRMQKLTLEAADDAEASPETEHKVDREERDKEVDNDRKDGNIQENREDKDVQDEYQGRGKGRIRRQIYSYEEYFKELTLEELHSKVPFIDWEKYFAIILGRTVNASTDVVQIFSLNLSYFDQLRAILHKSSNETIAYYIMLKLMYTLNADLPLAGMNNSMKCIEHLRGYMPLAMNYLYEAHIYKFQREQTDAALFEIYRQLRHRFRDLVFENHLQLNQTEQQYILDELEGMQLKIGNIPFKLSEQLVTEYYDELEFNSSSFYANHLQLLRLHTRGQLDRLKNQASPDTEFFYNLDAETESSSSPVKIFNSAILFPYGYLQMPFYRSDLHPLFQYSLLGFILAHEIVHAFDLFHIVYDKNSNYNRLGVSVAQHFGPHLGCLAGRESDNISENIADVSGLRLAYQTYFQDVLNGSHANLHSFKTSTTTMTEQELFFVNSVQFLCANIEKISMLDIKQLNLEHEMHDARVRQNWPLFEEYSRVFKCSKARKMNTSEMCRLW